MVHEFDPGPDGVCRGGWLNDAFRWVDCRSRQRSSVLHNDPEADFRQRHYHGGGDCMCFEDDPRGYYGAMADEAVVFAREERRFRDFDDGILYADDR